MHIRPGQYFYIQFLGGARHLDGLQSHPFMAMPVTSAQNAEKPGIPNPTSIRAVIEINVEHISSYHPSRAVRKRPSNLGATKLSYS